VFVATSPVANPDVRIYRITERTGGVFTNRHLVLAMVVLLLTAGCLGGGGGDSSSPAGASDEQSDTGSDADDASSTGNAGSDDVELTDVEEALRDAGSFTVVWTYSGVDERGTETEVRREFYADLEAERSLTVTSSVVDGMSDAGSMQQFFADGTTYTRSGPDDAPTYFAYEQESADVVATAIALSQARAYGADEDLSFEGRETFDGVSVERYELSRADSQLIRAGSAVGAGAGGTAGGVAEITDFQYVVLVDADGLSRFESWSFEGRTADGETVSGEWEYSLTKVGSTTVNDPDWLADAKASAQ
jgi:hypothetical protein